MTLAVIVIVVSLLLGGLIAALGDYLGSKVGKARLRLFNLRPRQTAILLTVLTGTIISASTLGLLLISSERFRQGLFELDEILRRRREIQRELSRVSQEKESLQRQQEEIIQGLKKINENYQENVAQLNIVSEQANSLRRDVKSLLAERQNLLASSNKLRELLANQNKELARQEQLIKDKDKILLDKEQQQKSLETQIAKQDQVIAELDQAITSKDKQLQARENRLQDLESQLAFLQREVELLEQYYQTYQELREKRIALVRGQVLAFAAVRIVDQKATIQAIDQLLIESNRAAIKAVGTESQVEQRVVQITESEVNQLAKQLQDGRDYVVRIISAGNYVQGEKQVRVFADVALNEKVFSVDEQIATVSVDELNSDEQELQKQIDLLLSAAQFRARRAGILGDIQVEDGNILKVINFMEKLKELSSQQIEIKAIATEDTYRAGPLKLRLLALSNGEIIFASDDE